MARVSDHNFEGQVALLLESQHLLIISQTDRVMIYSSNSLLKEGELEINLIQSDSREPA